MFFNVFRTGSLGNGALGKNSRCIQMVHITRRTEVEGMRPTVDHKLRKHTALQKSNYSFINKEPWTIFYTG